MQSPHSITWEYLQFEELSLDSLYAIMSLRQEVFVVEQNCPYLDADGKDQLSFHLLGWKNNTEKPLLAAYLRVIPPGVKYSEVSLGRVVIAPFERRQGLGRVIMEVALKKIEATYGKTPIRISAQMYLADFYRDLGFKAVGEVYDEDGIPHSEMLYNL